MSLSGSVKQAWRQHKAAASTAFAVYASYCGGVPPPRVPGISTALRLAVRLQQGRSIEEAAAREYLYRWRLALKSPVFGVPHPFGL